MKYIFFFATAIGFIHFLGCSGVPSHAASESIAHGGSIASDRTGEIGSVSAYVRRWPGDTRGKDLRGIRLAFFEPNVFVWKSGDPAGQHYYFARLDDDEGARVKSMIN
jgi:hypothetical protein